MIFDVIVMLKYISELVFLFFYEMIMIDKRATGRVPELEADLTSITNRQAPDLQVYAHRHARIRTVLALTESNR